MDGGGAAGGTRPPPGKRAGTAPSRVDTGLRPECPGSPSGRADKSRHDWRSDGCFLFPLSRQCWGSPGGSRARPIRTGDASPAESAPRTEQRPPSRPTSQGGASTAPWLKPESQEASPPSPSCRALCRPPQLNSVTVGSPLQIPNPPALLRAARLSESPLAPAPLKRQRPPANPWSCFICLCSCLWFFGTRRVKSNHFTVFSSFLSVKTTRAVTLLVL